MGKRIRRCGFEGCDKTAADGPLWRVTPDGEPPVFMCREHALLHDSWGNDD
jgi:hypothetical protein